MQLCMTRLEALGDESYLAKSELMACWEVCRCCRDMGAWL